MTQIQSLCSLGMSPIDFINKKELHKREEFIQAI
jgi:hypothetical protein